jgi:predicted Zn-dependent protease
MLTARARVLSNAGIDALRSWQTQADGAALASDAPSVQAGVLYGAAMAASRMRDATLARQRLDRLQTIIGADAEANRQVQWLAAEIDLAARDLSTAQWAALSDRLGSSNSQSTSLRRPGLLLQADVALQAGQGARLNAVTQQLQTWVATHPEDALAWQSLASTYTAQTQPLRALRAEAEARAAHLDYVGALDRLKAAQGQLAGSTKSNADHIDASIIDTRRRQIEALLKEQTLEG